MNQIDNEMSALMETVLDQHTGSRSFESVWRSYRKKNRYKMPGFSGMSVAATVILTVIALLAISLVGFAIYRNIDKTDYPFVDDPRVLGQWQAVDFVADINLFNPDQPKMTNLFLTNLVFIKGGKMLGAFNHSHLVDTVWKWTKGKILNSYLQTASEYAIKEINGITYLFFQWKTGDYTFRNLKPGYYILKKLDNKDYSNFQIQRREDSIDYPLVDDAQMRGEWKSVDFVSTIGEYQPGRRNWQGDLFLVGIRFDKNGKLTVTTLTETITAPFLTWTKGLIINKEDKTTSKCVIKEINGAVYMFFEWKSGDYIFRGEKPKYYVLIKTQPN